MRISSIANPGRRCRLWMVVFDDFIQFGSLERRWDNRGGRIRRMRTRSQIFRRHSGQDRPEKIVIAVEVLSKCETPAIADCEIQRKKRRAWLSRCSFAARLMAKIKGPPDFEHNHLILVCDFGFP